jgi:hypothetical protein
MSDIASPWAPPTMLAKLVPIEDPSCNRRLDFRSWKKVFQSSVSCVLADDGVEVGVDGESVLLVGEGMVELCLTIEFEEVLNMEGVLMVVLRRWIVFDAS